MAVFNELCQLASDENWCWKIGCATCGCMHFRSGLLELSLGRRPRDETWVTRKTDEGNTLVGTFDEMTARILNSPEIQALAAQADLSVLAADCRAPDWLGYLGLVLHFLEDREREHRLLTDRWTTQILELLRTTGETDSRLRRQLADPEWRLTPEELNRLEHELLARAAVNSPPYQVPPDEAAYRAWVEQMVDTYHLIDSYDRVWNGLWRNAEHSQDTGDLLRRTGLEWTVQAWDTVAVRGQARITLDRPTFVRSDTLEVLGSSSPHQPRVQNLRVAEFAMTLASGDHSFLLEGGGSLRGGRQVFFVLSHGADLVVGNTDEWPPVAVLRHDHQRGMTECFFRVIRRCGFGSFDLRPPQATRMPGPRGLRVSLHPGTIEDEASRLANLCSREFDHWRDRANLLAGRRARNRGDFWASQGFRSEVHIAALQAIFAARSDLVGPTAWNAVSAISLWLTQRRREDAVDRDDPEHFVHDLLFGDIPVRSGRAVWALW